MQQVGANKPSNPKLISIKNLVERWDTNRHFIWKKCKSGEIPSEKLGDRWFIDMQYVLDFEGKIKRESESRRREKNGI